MSAEPGRSPQALEAEIAARLGSLRHRMRTAAERAGRDPADVALVGVCKRQPIERIAAAVRAGVDRLGENYVQEAARQREELASVLGSEVAGRLRWHLVGHLQRNKAASAAGIFDTIETVDRAAIARALDRRAGEAGRRLELLVQINVSGEPQKSGARAEELPDLLAACAALEHVAMVGLMAVPAASPDPEASRGAFAALRALRDAARREPGGEALEALSMGMSSDFEVAIEEGATLVRIGTALFGAREERP